MMITSARLTKERLWALSEEIPVCSEEGPEGLSCSRPVNHDLPHVGSTTLVAMAIHFGWQVPPGESDMVFPMGVWQ